MISADQNVELFNRRTGAPLGSGRVLSVTESRISVVHDGGALTMVAGLEDPDIRIETYPYGLKDETAYERYLEACADARDDYETEG